MNFLPAITFAACSTVDGFAVGLSLGLRRTRIGWAANLMVGLITLLGTALSMLMGCRLTAYISPETARILGGGIILSMGLWGLACPGTEDTISAKESGPVIIIAQRSAALLGCGLALNNVGLGVGASMTGLQPVPAALLSFGCSLLFLWGGNRLGRSHFASTAGSSTERCANWLMVLLGIWELLGIC